MITSHDNVSVNQKGHTATELFFGVVIIFQQAFRIITFSYFWLSLYTEILKSKPILFPV